MTVFREEPFILVVRNKGTKEVENLVFSSIHLQSLFYIGDQKEGLLYDFIWNAACTIANVPVQGSDVFYRVTSSKRARAGGERKGQGQLALAIKHRSTEKTTGYVLPEEVSLNMFSPIIRRNTEWWETHYQTRGDKSVARLVLELAQEKSRTVQAAGGWQPLARGRATHLHGARCHGGG